MSKKKQALLEHSEKLFYQNGFHSVGLKRVVTESGVALMTLYNHFDSKEELIQEVLKHREERYFSQLKLAVERCGLKNHSTLALELANLHIEWLRTSGFNGCMFLRAKEEYSYENQDIVNQVLDHKRTLLSFFQELGFSYAVSVQFSMLFEGVTALSESLELDDIAKEFKDMIAQVIEK
ncbi:TetR/AcrR family transcriptional regulator [Alkalicoccobacillus porphyridii]|uniref:TetR/AcrR family transcriptional regulator n=1 Tax=Alkalicoccobacillus porphyridii TaxID=2597270 RepID=A0A554A233_9BACI|nr:TetR/AcrR family transcriptional regulator [Alkalicoccobacillus porphyridii]TSB47743.1 TetR/AcrR family transcriptional regulator [Alkalicoccobacillus porphyridii]